MDQTDISNIIDRYILADAEAMAFIFSIILALSLIYITKSKIVRHKQCPSCKTEKAYRTGQNFIESCLFRLENYKKYKCVNCARAFYIKNKN
jgi:transposase-like protein